MSGHQLEVGLNWTTTFFNQQNKKPIFSITPDGRFIPGEGLSDDEVTQHFAEVMAGAFQSQIRYSVSKHMADEIERLREELYEIKLAAAGGEDVPGAANMVTANDVEKWVTKYCEEIERLREALRELIDDYEYDSITGLGIAKARAALGEGKE